jgi:hypothetical protein
MRAPQALHPVDLVVALHLGEHPGLRYAEIGGHLGVSSSTAHAAVRRLQFAGLVRPESRAVNRLALREFLAHGVRYAFPARPGAPARGIPTAHAAPPLADRVVAGEAFVWPNPDGPTIGRAVAPLYPQAHLLPQRAPGTYRLVALTDALRVGQARERNLAVEEIDARLGGEAG